MTRVWIAFTLLGCCATALIGWSLGSSRNAVDNNIAQSLDDTSKGPLSAGITYVIDGELPQDERLKPLLDGTITAVAPSDLPFLHAVAKDKQAGETLRNEVMNLLTREHDDTLVELCVQIINSADETERMRAFAAQHLAVWSHKPQLNNVTRQQILRTFRTILQAPNSSPPMFREAWWALAQHQDETALNKARNIIQNQFPEDRLDLAIRIARQHNWTNELVHIRKAAQHQDSTIRISALECIAYLQDTSALHIVQAATMDDDLNVRTAAINAQKVLQADQE